MHVKNEYTEIIEQMSNTQSTQETRHHHHHHHESTDVSQIRKRNIDSAEVFKNQSLRAIHRKKIMKKALYYFLIVVAVIVVLFCAYIYTI